MLEEWLLSYDMSNYWLDLCANVEEVKSLIRTEFLNYYVTHRGTALYHRMYDFMHDLMTTGQVEAYRRAIPCVMGGWGTFFEIRFKFKGQLESMLIKYPKK